MLSMTEANVWCIDYYSRALEANSCKWCGKQGERNSGVKSVV